MVLMGNLYCNRKYVKIFLIWMILYWYICILVYIECFILFFMINNVSFSVYSIIFFLYLIEIKKDLKKYFYGIFKSIVVLV